MHSEGGVFTWSLGQYQIRENARRKTKEMRSNFEAMPSQSQKTGQDICQ